MAGTAAKDVDHEMAELLALAQELRQPSRSYPPHVWSAMRVAYATHFRAFLAFYHSGRPLVRRDKDVPLRDFVPAGPRSVPALLRGRGHGRLAQRSRYRAGDPICRGSGWHAPKLALAGVEGAAARPQTINSIVAPSRLMRGT